MSVRTRCHTLDHDKYEQCKQAVVPVLVETRQRDTEDLGNEEGRSGIFREQRSERRDRGIERILLVKRQ